MLAAICVAKRYVLIFVREDVGRSADPTLYDSVSIFAFPLQILPPASEYEAGLQPRI